MQVIVHVEPGTARKLHAGEHNSRESKEIAEAIKDLGVSLGPVHPGASDPRLIGTFAVSVPDASAAERVIDRVRNCDAVEAAYVKPPEAAP